MRIEFCINEETSFNVKRLLIETSMQIFTNKIENLAMIKIHVAFFQYYCLRETVTCENYTMRKKKEVQLLALNQQNPRM